MRKESTYNTKEASHFNEKRRRSILALFGIIGITFAAGLISLSCSPTMNPVEATATGLAAATLRSYAVATSEQRIINDIATQTAVPDSREANMVPEWQREATIKFDLFDSAKASNNNTYDSYSCSGLLLHTTNILSLGVDGLQHQYTLDYVSAISHCQSDLSTNDVVITTADGQEFYGYRVYATLTQDKLRNEYPAGNKTGDYPTIFVFISPAETKLPIKPAGLDKIPNKYEENLTPGTNVAICGYPQNTNGQYCRVTTIVEDKSAYDFGPHYSIEDAFTRGFSGSNAVNVATGKVLGSYRGPTVNSWETLESDGVIMPYSNLSYDYLKSYMQSIEKDLTVIDP